MSQAVDYSYFSHRVVLSSVKYGEQSAVDLKNLRQQLLEKQDHLTRIEERGANSCRIDNLSFTTISAEKVADTLATMRKQVQWFTLGSLLALAGVVYTGRQTYIDRAKLDKMPFWLRVAVSVALFFVALILVGQANKERKAAKKHEADCSLTVAECYNQRNTILGVHAPLLKPNGKSYLFAHRRRVPNEPIFTLPEGTSRKSCSQAERTDVFIERLESWKDMARESLSNPSNPNIGKIFFTDPVPYSRETIQFFLGNNGVKRYATQIQQLEKYRRDYEKISLTAPHRQERIVELAQAVLRLSL